MSYRILIPTAGTGSRLREMTLYINKSLITIANRPALAHLIEQFPKDSEFVIALGHKGHLVREFLELAYPNRIFFFSEVSPYEGPGSGLGLSILSCKKHLQAPFVFTSCDTLVKEPIPAPDHNWMGYAHLNDISLYRTLRTNHSKVLDVCEKGANGADLKAYIGLAGIHDYRRFWKAMDQGGENAIATGEACGMRNLVEHEVAAYGFTWFDTGSPAALARTRHSYREPNAPNILDKPNEAIWFVGDKVVKFSDDEGFIAKRAKRAVHISDYVPAVLSTKPHMYMYQKVRGRIMSEAVTLPLFLRFLETCKIFWERHELSPKDSATFRQTCQKFYKTKTRERIKLFYKNFSRQDSADRINGKSLPRLAELLENLDWDWICQGLPGRFHGDLHFENILWSENDGRFVFLDWRQDFGGDLKTGDIYYDLAKIMHGLIICHELIAKDQFVVEWEGDEIRYDFHRKQILVDCERAFEEWLLRESYDLRKVRILTAIIYLNIAALHHYPYSLFLYALGKKMLKTEVDKI